VRYEECNLGFSTADAGDVKLSYSRGDLLLEFLDWRENLIKVRFTDVIRFNWTHGLDDAVRQDTCYRVLDSPWTLTDLAAEGNSVFCHYKLCFNACGTLDVACGATSTE
jgi:hypothetical protein